MQNFIEIFFLIKNRHVASRKFLGRQEQNLVRQIFFRLDCDEEQKC